MSKIHYFFLFYILFISMIKSNKAATIFHEITLTDHKITLGNSGEGLLTIRLNEVPENTIDFEKNTIIIGIDLEKPDSNFIAQVHHHSSSEDQEVYKINFKTATLGSNSFIITLYDYENQKSYPSDPVEFEIIKKDVIIEEIIPDPKQTKLVKNPLEYVRENDTITFEFSMKDKKGNDIIGNNTFLKKLKVINNDDIINDAKIDLSEDGKIFIIELLPEYLPLLQKINIEFNGEKETLKVFLNDILVNVKVSPLYSKTIVNCENCETIKINDSLLIDIYLYNFKNISVDFDDYSKDFEIILEGPIDNEFYETKSYSIKKKADDKNEYKIITLEEDIFMHSGTYTIKIYENDILIKEYEIIIKAGDFDINGFILEYIDPDFDPLKVYVDAEFGIKLKGTDFYGNFVPLPLEDDIKLKLIDENETEIQYSTRFDDNNEGVLSIYLKSKTDGFAKLKMFYKNREILKINKNKELPEFYFNLMKCIQSLLSKDENENNLIVGRDITFYLQCIDKLGNNVQKGGEDFTSESFFVSNGKYKSFEIKIKDLNTGKYSFNFIPFYEGQYYIRIYLGNKLFNETTYNIEKMQCGGDDPFLCPNKDLCVSDPIDCIEPKNDCPRETPFLCKVNGEEQCTKSQLDCDCPDGYIRCEYMKYCVPKNREDMCADFSQIPKNLCQRLKQFKYLGQDGICRISEDLSPTQYVCPIGKVLCADLSCRDNYDECAVSDYCEEGEIRCGEQSCVEDHTECPSTISCQNKKYVCPNGSCVDSELECERLPECSEEEPYRCQDNLCVKDQNSCVKNVACGHRMALCKDLVCRTTCNNDL